MKRQLSLAALLTVAVWAGSFVDVRGGSVHQNYQISQVKLIKFVQGQTKFYLTDGSVVDVPISGGQKWLFEVAGSSSGVSSQGVVSSSSYSVLSSSSVGMLSSSSDLSNSSIGLSSSVVDITPVAQEGMGLNKLYVNENHLRIELAGASQVIVSDVRGQVLSLGGRVSGQWNYDLPSAGAFVVQVKNSLGTNTYLIQSK